MPVRNRTKKTAAPEATTTIAHVPSDAETSLEPKKKPSRSKSPAASATPAETPKPVARPSRSKKATPTVTAEPEVKVEEKAAKPRRALFGRKETISAVPVAAPEPVAVIESPSPRTTRRKKSGLPTELHASAEPAAEQFAIGDDRLLEVTFRSKADTASPTPARKPAAVAKAPVATVAEPIEQIAGEDLPILQWRTLGSAPAAPEGEATESDPGEESDLRRKRRRRRRGEDSEPTESSEREPVGKAPETREPRVAAAVATTPPVVARPPIPVPENAPQIVMRAGIPNLVRNHRVYPPILFFGSAGDERRAGNVIEELRMAAEAGVHLHSFLVDLEVDLAQVENATSVAAYLLSKALEVDPESQVIFRLAFQAPKNWETRFPKSLYRDAHGEVAEPSVCDDEFWGEAESCLKKFVKSVRMLETHEHIMGVHLERGEWFLSADAGYDTSSSAKNKFREWARRRYVDDEVTLRASWFDGSVRFDNIQIPEYRPEGGDGDRFIRSSRRQRRYVDYHLFLSDITSQRLTDLAYAAKAAGEGHLLVGVSYGYTFEWSHPGSGHLSLGKLLRSQEIDFVAGPPSYRNREPGGSAPFPGPIDSFALNGKLYLSEEDFKTSLSTGHEPDDFNPPLKTPQALESVHWRGLGAALCHGSGVAWMDLWGNGWLKTHSVWERASRVRQALIERMEAPLGDPEVAIFIDERALAYLVDSNAFQLLVQNVRESVLRAGVSAAFYLLSDLQHREKFPESKLYVFLNAWDIRPDLRAAIKNRLQRDNKVLFWLYSAGLFDAGRDSLERAREVTGIALKPQPFYSKAGTTILNRRHPLSEAFPDRSLIGGTKLEPSYFAIPEGAVVLGEYSQTGLPSFVVKEFNEDPNARWTSVFLGEPLVNPALIRALAQMAGAHVWNFQEDVVHVRAPFCTVHCSGTGHRTLTLPDKASAYNLLTAEWATIDSTHLRFYALDGSTHVFLVGPRADLEHLLQVNPDEVLRIENLPERDQNVLHDSSDFDVPIMKLDEWMEGGDQDEVADEWFLRPAQITEEERAPEQAEESPEKVGRRRRRRRRGRGGPGMDEFDEVVSSRPESSNTTSDSGEFVMNVTFRKRD